MSAAPQEAPPPLARVVVALDEGPGAEPLLAFACRLASAAGARLTGLFVQDSQLLELAGSGLARELGSYSGAERPLRPRDLERAIERRAADAQQRLADAARRAGVRWSFRLLRGRVHRELIGASVPGDLLVLGRGRGVARLGGAVRRVVEEGHAPLLILGGRQPREPQRVIVLASGVDPGERVWSVAADLAAALGGRLETVLPPGADALESRLPDRPPGRAVDLRVRRLSRLDADTLFAEVDPGEGDILALSPGGALGRPDELIDILARARGPVLLVG